MPQPIRIVFDLDDTLYPERQFALSGFAAASRWASERLDTPDMVPRMTELLDAGLLGALFKQVLQEHAPSRSESMLADFVGVYRDHAPQIALYDDAQSALSLATRQGAVGLITDGNHQVQVSKVTALGIGAHFAKIVYTGALGGREFHKPHPLGFELMEEAMDVSPNGLVYVGDNPRKDFVTPNLRQWTTVQVRREQGIHDASQSVPGGEAHHVIDSLAELSEVLGIA
jgi:putative hydrolase of the HAD superfamily